MFPYEATAEFGLFAEPTLASHFARPWFCWAVHGQSLKLVYACYVFQHSAVHIFGQSRNFREAHDRNHCLLLMPKMAPQSLQGHRSMGKMRRLEEVWVCGLMVSHYFIYWILFFFFFLHLCLISVFLYCLLCWPFSFCTLSYFGAMVVCVLGWWCVRSGWRMPNTG